MKKLFPLLLLLAACATPRDGETTYAGIDTLSPAQLAEAKRKPDFTKHVGPILATKCAVCHNKKSMPGLTSLENKTQAFKPGASGVPVIVPGHPESSLLIAHVKETHAKVAVMPQVGERVTKDEIAILRAWIAQGANWPDGKAGRLKVELATP